MDKKLIDDTFYCEQHSWGTWSSYDKDGKCIITSLTEEICISATRWFLKAKQEGFEQVDNKDSKSYSGSVDYKL